MDEKFQFENFFVKDESNLEMLKQALKQENLDEGLIPILKKFFLLPITPRESCYGHVKQERCPYLSYVDDEVKNEQDASIQRLFKENISELNTQINQIIGSGIVLINLDRVDYGGGPVDYTLQFEIIDKNIFRKSGEEILNIIWEEFSKYLDKFIYEKND